MAMWVEEKIMILVFGGAFNGKLGFVKEEFEVSE